MCGCAQACRDGEWVLATFEVGEDNIAVAGRVEDHGDARRIVFAPRDWEHLEAFADADESPRRSFTPTGVPANDGGYEDAGHLGAERPGADCPDAESLGAERPDAESLDAEGLDAEGLDAEGLDAGVAAEEEEEESAPVSTGVPMRALDGFQGDVLVVDDDAALRSVLSGLLRSVGFGSEGVDTGEDALDVLREAARAADGSTPEGQRPASLAGASASRLPSLVILDWNLPGMTGVEVCRRIRATVGLENLPIMFLTSHGGQSDVATAFEAGADDYVVKPFRAPELRARVISLLRRSLAPSSRDGSASVAVAG